MPIAISTTAGGVAIMRVLGDADVQAAVDQWSAANPGQYASHTQISDDAIPADRSQRGAWALRNGAIVVDLARRPVPARVPRRQAMAVLIKYGHDTQIESLLMAQLEQAENSGNAKAILACKMALNDYTESQFFERDWPLIEVMRQALGWTTQYVDGLFIEAESL
jgi:hypothetical protein